MITIPVLIPVPTIEVIGNEVKIDRIATELAKQQKLLGYVLTLDDEKLSPICCACKEPKAHISTLEPPEGFRWGGWFCNECLAQGRLARQLNLVIDQATCDISPVIAFDQRGTPYNVV